MRQLRRLDFVLLLVAIGAVTCQNEVFRSNCLKPSERGIHPHFVSQAREPISFQVSNRITHQLMTRVYATFLREVQGYDNIEIVKIPEDPVTNGRNLYYLFSRMVSYGELLPTPNVDLEVWSLPDYHLIPPKVKVAGPITNAGRFGIFIPKVMVTEKPLLINYPYTKFSKDYVRMFDIQASVLESIRKKAERVTCEDCTNNVFTPKHCVKSTCGYLLAADFYSTSFVMAHINELGLNFKVIWLGSRLRKISRELFQLYTTDSAHIKRGAKFVVFSWTPSDVIDFDIEYIPIAMPHCEALVSSSSIGCKYELTPLLKYYAENLENAPEFHESLTKVHFSKEHIRGLVQIYEKYEPEMQDTDHPVEVDTVSNTETITVKLLKDADNEWEQVMNRAACEWIQNNRNISMSWAQQEVGKESLFIGGIFPITKFTKMYNSIDPASFQAIDAVNNNTNIMRNHNLRLFNLNGGCQSDFVMNTFVNYYVKRTKIIGVLGPACSETVEPIAGLSKYSRMVVISYSAEGVSFEDRETYPYFFRTIGENRQYEHVYFQLFKKLNWKRVSALTENGQKYTEYILHMEQNMKSNGIELNNKKFLRGLNAEGMRKYLLELQTHKAKIIIADINDDIAKMVLCEAYNLKMTAQNGYVWFLPAWLSKNWNTTNSSSSRSSKDTTTCTYQQMMDAIDGHFSLAHEPFGDRNAIMQENITIGEWLDEYTKRHYNGIVPTTDYGGFAYDGVWVYAMALDKLMNEDPNSSSDLHSVETTERLIEIIKKTDFQGVSGRVRFSDSGSRYTNVNILQWLNGTSRIVGTFQPHVSDNQTLLHGGTLSLNQSAITWLSDGKQPDDGTQLCGLEALARLFNTDCDHASYILTVFVCIFIIVAVSTASYIFWKRKYHEKLEQSNKLLKNLGINLFDSTIPGNTLDKWEVPKDQVVINRRLGEGAFGTVYGGEAKIDDNGWTAVAVKTLKVGSTTEDRLDFLAEAEAMKKFDHQNIVKLLGVCLQSEPVYTIMEYMLYGDLKTFLLARRHLVTEKITDTSDISSQRLTMMAMDVARALSYLTEMKYVHRDVACRNCMVNAQRIVKLGDFGMARPTYESDYYRFNRKGLLPVRWMSPESLNLGLFTPASDIWSFGVLLYEIITFGSFPFQGMTNNQVLEYVKSGNTLTIPAAVKSQLEGLMLACWNHQYKLRPSAKEVLECISIYPRLLSPCLDVPLASVQMPESESDQMELLPGIRKRSVTPIVTPAGNGAAKAMNLNNFDINIANNLPTNNSYLNGLNIPVHERIVEESNQPTSSSSSSYYNPIEPLLQQQQRHNPEISKSNTSLLRYVPMRGFGKNSTPSIDISDGRHEAIATSAL